jgi:hypothetical protein
VVVFWSKAAANSERVQKEIGEAIKEWSEDRLLLATLDDTPLPMALRDLAPVEIRSGSESGTAQLMERAKQIAEKTEVPQRVESEPTKVVIGEPRRMEREVFHPVASHAPVPAAPSEAPVLAAEAAVPTRRFHFSRLALLLGVIVAGLLVLGSIVTLVSLRQKSDETTVSAPTLSIPPNQEKQVDDERKRKLIEQELQTLDRRYHGRTNYTYLDLLPESFLVFAVGAAVGAGLIGMWLAWSRWRSNRAQSVLVPNAAPPMTLMQVPTGNGTAQVFVSYSRTDQQMVDNLVRQLEQMGHSVWIDRQTAGLERYAAKIVPAIRASRLVALMCSQHAFATGQVIREVYLAGDFRKPFIVFQLDPTEPPDEVLYFVSGFPRVPVNVSRELLRSEIARLITA